METLALGVVPADYFEMLDNIRESGVMNMFAAPRWMEENCGLSRADARAVFIAWTQIGKEEEEDNYNEPTEYDEWQSYDPDC